MVGAGSDGGEPFGAVCAVGDVEEGAGFDPGVLVVGPDVGAAGGDASEVAVVVGVGGGAGVVVHQVPRWASRSARSLQAAQVHRVGRGCGQSGGLPTIGILVVIGEPGRERLGGGQQQRVTQVVGADDNRTHDVGVVGV